jgi:hypothetical protein
MTTTSTIKMLSIKYLFNFFERLNISKCFDHIIMIWFLLLLIIFSYVEIVISVIFVSFSEFDVKNFLFLLRIFLLYIIVDRWLCMQFLIQCLNWKMKFRFFFKICTSCCSIYDMFKIIWNLSMFVIKYHKFFRWFFLSSLWYFHR